MKKKITPKVKDHWLELVECNEDWRKNNNVENGELQRVTGESIEQGMAETFADESQGDHPRYRIIELENDTLIAIYGGTFDTNIIALYRAVKDDEWENEEESNPES